MLRVIFDNYTINQSNTNELLKSLMICDIQRLKIADAIVTDDMRGHLVKHWNLIMMARFNHQSHSKVNLSSIK